jgi:hypothetical protein
VVKVKQSMVFNFNKEIEQSNHEKEALAEKKFLKLNTEIANSMHILLKDLLIESTTYHDLLTTIGTNKNMLYFTMDNVEVKGIFN